MFLIFRFFFLIVGLFFFVTLITGVTVAMRLRRHLRNAFLKETGSPPTPPAAGQGDVIEGEFTVLDEDKNKR